MNDRHIDYRSLAQHQASVAKMSIDDQQNPAASSYFFYNRLWGLRIVFSLGTDPNAARETGEECWSRSGLLPSPDRVAQPVLHQMSPKHGQ